MVREKDGGPNRPIHEPLPAVIFALVKGFRSRWRALLSKNSKPHPDRLSPAGMRCFLLVAELPSGVLVHAADKEVVVVELPQLPALLLVEGDNAVFGVYPEPPLRFTGLYDPCFSHDRFSPLLCFPDSSGLYCQ